jgi:hypothetical protein
MLLWPWGHNEQLRSVSGQNANGGLTWFTPIIKDREAFYADGRRIWEMNNQINLGIANQCVALVAAANPRTGRECSGLPQMQGAFIYQ